MWFKKPIKNLEREAQTEPVKEESPKHITVNISLNFNIKEEDYNKLFDTLTHFSIQENRESYSRFDISSRNKK